MMQSNKTEKETIHSGHFMISQFEADAQDDEYEVAVPVPEVSFKNQGIIPLQSISAGNCNNLERVSTTRVMSLSIETSLIKLFQCMSIAYRQKLTSPKWNRFRGIRLRWKEKIRLNNYIWRCWHMQFVLKRNIGVCQFASPLDADIHSKPEAVVLEGKYWKRKLSAVTAEYKRWRLFHQKLTNAAKEQDMVNRWNLTSTNRNGSIISNENYTDLFSDTLFSTIGPTQPFIFPNMREKVRGANLADLIQPSLIQLQPNLDEYMDMLEPFQDLLSPPVKSAVTEEHRHQDDLYDSININYGESMSTSNFYQTLANAEMNSVTTKNENSRFYNSHVTTLASTNVNNSSLLSNPSYPIFETTNSCNLNALSLNQTDISSLSNFNYKVLPVGRSMKSTVSSINNVKGELANSSKIIEKTPLQNGSCFLYDQNKVIENEQNHSESMYNNALLPKFLTNTRTNSCHSSYQCNNITGAKLSFCGHKLNYNGEVCCGMNRRQNGAYCTALLGRRSRTPDHILSSSSNPVGYCKPRVPLAYNHGYNDGSLISLSNNHQPVGISYRNLDTISNNPQIISHPVSHCKHDSQSMLKTQFDKLSALTSPEETRPPNYYTVNNNDAHSSFLVNPFVFNGYQENITTTATTPTTINTTTTCVAAVLSNISQKSASTSSNSSSTSESLSSIMADTASCTMSPASALKNSKVTFTPYKEHRRVCHINSEQKRRCNIKNGFDTLYMLIPHLAQNLNIKMSKATMLQKSAKYIQQLCEERNQLKDEIESLKQQVESMNSAISNCINLLPVTGAPVSRHKVDKIKDIFNEYRRDRTKQNWKFWILSLLCEPLLPSFNSVVSTTDIEELFQTTLQWAENYCSLIDLRPIVLNALRYLCTKTEILSNPDELPNEAQTLVFNSS